MLNVELDIEKKYNVYFFRREKKNPIPGYDQISIVAFSKQQAENYLTNLITDQMQEFNFSHAVTMEVFEGDCDE